MDKYPAVQKKRAKHPRFNMRFAPKYRLVTSRDGSRATYSIALSSGDFADFVDRTTARSTQRHCVLA
jgi:hypothetical protein